MSEKNVTPMPEPDMSTWMKWMAESDAAMNIFLSGIASGVTSTLTNWSTTPEDVARQMAQDFLEHVQSDPIACEQFRQAIHCIVYGIPDGPTHVTAYRS